jgi:hypothetical protein
MEGSFFAPANRDVIWHVLIQQHLFDRDGLALVMTCKFLYGLTTPVTRAQMRVGLRFKMPRKALPARPHESGARCSCPACGVILKSPHKAQRHVALRCHRASYMRKCHAPCVDCGHPKAFHMHMGRYACPLKVDSCVAAFGCKRAGTLQTIRPWRTMARFKSTCAHCGRRLFRAYHYGRDACAMCGIYCGDCIARKCCGCDQIVRGRHICATDVDRLAYHVQTQFCHVVIDFVKHQEPLPMITAVCRVGGFQCKWVLVSDEYHIPPIPHNRDDIVYCVRYMSALSTFIRLIQYDAQTLPRTMHHMVCYGVSACATCFQTVDPYLTFCSHACEIQSATQ